MFRPLENPKTAIYLVKKQSIDSCGSEIIRESAKKKVKLFKKIERQRKDKESKKPKIVRLIINLHDKTLSNPSYNLSFSIVMYFMFALALVSFLILTYKLINLLLYY